MILRPRRQRPISPMGGFPMAQATLRTGDLTAIVGDNGAEMQHRTGYNGLWSLTHREEATNLFVPAVAGLNLEHTVSHPGVRSKQGVRLPRPAGLSPALPPGGDLAR